MLDNDQCRVFLVNSKLANRLFNSFQGFLSCDRMHRVEGSLPRHLCNRPHSVQFVLGHPAACSRINMVSGDVEGVTCVYAF